MKLVTSNLYPHYTPDHCAFCVSRQFLHFFLIFSAHFNIQVCYTIHHKKISCRSLARWLSDSSRLSDKLQVVCVPVVRFFVVIGQATGRLRAGCPILRGYRTTDSLNTYTKQATRKLIMRGACLAAFYYLFLPAPSGFPETPRSKAAKCFSDAAIRRSKTLLTSSGKSSASRNCP